VENVAQAELLETGTECSSQYPKEKSNLKHLRIEGRIILKRTLTKKY
jgi:hypothetical protein